MEPTLPHYHSRPRSYSTPQDRHRNRQDIHALYRQYYRKHQRANNRFKGNRNTNKTNKANKEATTEPTPETKESQLNQIYQIPSS